MEEEEDRDPQQRPAVCCRLIKQAPSAKLLKLTVLPACGLFFLGFLLVCLFIWRVFCLFFLVLHLAALL